MEKDYSKEIKRYLNELSLEEKASLCSGEDMWFTKKVDRLQIPRIMVADGPHGLRKQKDESEEVGLLESVPATCFPSGAALASSWDQELIGRVGEALGKEAKAEQVSVVLGPAVNIKRSPLCGRNFEYYSEDPFLSSRMAASFIKGVQGQGIGISIKHFAVNNQEHRRLVLNAEVDKRTLREIYLASFEYAVKEAKPWTIMSAYNKVNGTYASEHPYLLGEVLRKEWDYQGVVVTDWGANHDRVAGISVGEDLEMPGNGGINDRKIVEAVQDGRLTMDELDKVCSRLLELILKSTDLIDSSATVDLEENHRLAREAASQSMVLLKNEKGQLPLPENISILLVGAFADKPRFQGGGSSHIRPTCVSSAWEVMKQKGQIAYSQGFLMDRDEEDSLLEKDALEKAALFDRVVYFAGLPDRYESEGYDRTHMSLPPNQNSLLEKILEVNPRVTVVLSNGSPVEMPWLEKVPAVLEAYLGGQASGEALADILYGRVNPSGKLAETFPLRLEDNPSYLNFPGKRDHVNYAEGLFVGYRYYDARKCPVLFPFGHGLSYSRFELSDLTVRKDSILETEPLELSVKLSHCSGPAGRQVVQLYVEDVEASLIRPVRELKAFQKVELQAGESRELHFSLDRSAFAFFDTELDAWNVESGEFRIHLGFSSSDLPLCSTVEVVSLNERKPVFAMNTTLGELSGHPKGQRFQEQILEKLPFALVNSEGEKDLMMEAMLWDTPIRHAVMWSRGDLSEEEARKNIEELNR